MCKEAEIGAILTVQVPDWYVPASNRDTFAPQRTLRASFLCARGVHWSYLAIGVGGGRRETEGSRNTGPHTDNKETAPGSLISSSDDDISHDFPARAEGLLWLAV